jgi:hypothetical protein
MRVRRNTFEQDLKEKEEAFLKLTGEERLRMMRKVSDRMRNLKDPPQLEGSRVRVVRNPEL